MFKDLALPIPSVTSKQTPLSKGILCYLKKKMLAERLKLEKAWLTLARSEPIWILDQLHKRGLLVTVLSS